MTKDIARGSVSLQECGHESNTGPPEYEAGILATLLSERSIGRPRRVLEDNIRMDLQGIWCKGVGYIHLAQDRVQWRDFMNMVMNPRVP
jgi:hypothetical protein